MKDGEIKHKLSPAQVSVMLHRVTEPPYFGKFWDHFEAGTYRCAACDTALFASEEKFDSKTGWPSFRRPINERDLQFKSEAGPDDKVEIRCKRCKGHLGYVISGENPYYRINSVCLIFAKREAPAAASIAPTDTVGTKKPQSKKSAPEQTPEPEPAPATGWTTGSLIAASVISLGVGVLGMYMYMTYTPLPVIPETATTTTESSTTTPAGAEPAQVTLPNSATDNIPAEATEILEQAAPEPDTGTTSTQ